MTADRGAHQNGNSEDSSKEYNTNPTFNGTYKAPIDSCGPPGRWFRNELLRWIIAGTDVILYLQRYRRPWLDSMMRVLSFLGTEEFYTPVVVILGWVIDARLARLFVILMGIGFYFTTASKNFLRLPRPPVPPVEVVEKTYDWSLPSLHSVLGVMMPWYIFLYTYQHNDLPLWVTITMLAVCISWSTSVSISRLYLGVHSPADLVSGLLPGVALLLLFLRVDDFIYRHISLTSHWVMPVAFVIYVSILILHPTSSPPTKSYGETVITNSVAFGFIMAHQRTLGANHAFYEALLNQAAAAGVAVAPSRIALLGLARILIGFPLVMLTRLIMKPTMKRLVRRACGVVGVDCYYYPDYRKLTLQLSKHYTPGFHIPPVWKKQKTDKDGDGTHSSNGHATCISETYGSNGHSHTNGFSNGTARRELESRATIYNVILRHGGSLPLDIDVPTKFVTYTTMSWVAMELIPHLFYSLGLSLVV